MTGGKRAAIVTLGCKVNWYDSQAMAQALASAGFAMVEEGSQADVYIVNTCAVTQEAERKSRQAVRRLLRLHPEASVIAAGCSAQKDPAGYSGINGIAAVCGTANRAEAAGIAARVAEGERGIAGAGLPELEYENIPAEAQSGHTRATLKIEDGCDARCAYCIIPDLRGNPRSRPLESIESEAAALRERGFQEIVLVGINLSRYGVGLPVSLTLADAVEAAAQPGIARVRLGSLEPEAINEALLARLSKVTQFCPHFHLSLQSGSAETLKRMGRRYTPDQYVEKLKMIRSIWAWAGITTDVIVGFPGETDEEFAKSARFVSDAGFLKVHVFPYSRRPGTRAAELPGQLSHAVKQARAAAMQAACAPGQKAFLESMVGTTAGVLFEGEVKGKPGWMHGYTANYIDVSAPADKEARGNVMDVSLEEIDDEGMTGTLLSLFGRA